MATLRKKQNLAAVPMETQEYPKNSQSQNSSAPGISDWKISRLKALVASQFAEHFYLENSL